MGRIQAKLRNLRSEQQTTVRAAIEVLHQIQNVMTQFQEWQHEIVNRIQEEEAGRARQVHQLHHM